MLQRKCGPLAFTASVVSFIAALPTVVADSGKIRKKGSSILHTPVYLHICLKHGPTPLGGGGTDIDSWNKISFWGNLTAVIGKYEIDMAPTTRPDVGEHAARGALHMVGL